MYHALGMNHNLDLIGLEIEQPRLDDFQGFVHQRRRVDADLRADFPGRVLQCILGRDMGQFFSGSPSERAAGRREDDSADLPPRPRFEGLEDGRVYAVDRQDFALANEPGP